MLMLFSPRREMPRPVMWSQYFLLLFAWTTCWNSSRIFGVFKFNEAHMTSLVLATQVKHVPIKLPRLSLYFRDQSPSLSKRRNLTMFIWTIWYYLTTACTSPGQRLLLKYYLILNWIVWAHISWINTCQWVSQFSPFRYFPVVHNYRSTNKLLDISYTSGRSRRSLVAASSVNKNIIESVKTVSL